MVQGVEAVVVGDDDVGLVLEQQRQHVVALLADGVVQRSVSLGVLVKSEPSQCRFPSQV